MGLVRHRSIGDLTRYAAANPWFPYGDSGCEVQPIQADPTTGHWIVKLPGPAGGNLGIYGHYGSVLGFTRGAWRYLDHEWVSRTGDIVHETPGSVRTFQLQGDTEIIFFVEGALEYVDAEGRTIAHEDWRSITQKDVDFCAQHGLDAVDVSRPRPLTRDRAALA